MSAGRTNAVTGGGAEPEFLELNAANTIQNGNDIVITTPKSIKTICGLGLVMVMSDGNDRLFAYPANFGGKKTVISLRANGGGLSWTLNPEITSNTFSFSSNGTTTSVDAGYLCYIPE